MADDTRVPEPRVDHTVDSLKGHIRSYYTALFESKRSLHLPIKTGKDLASALAYSEDLVRTVPEEYWEYFHPCSNPLPFLNVLPGDLILNLGCGVGIDSFALALKEPSSVQIVNMDVVPIALKLGFVLGSHFEMEGKSIEWVCGDGERLPFREECFDSVFLNGVFNLFPHKEKVLQEIKRVTKPGGSLIIADLCLEGHLPDYFRGNGDAWAWCMSGAHTSEAVLSQLQNLGFKGVVDLHLESRGDMFYPAVFSATKQQR
jgi:arsenite methyltransferase